MLARQTGIPGRLRHSRRLILMREASVMLLEQVLLGKYKVVQLLDQGGMSLLFLGKQLDSNRDVVVKVLQPQLATSKNREHFRREIHIMSRFQHPNAVAYFDADMNHPNGPILVMEYLRGIDLNLLLRRTGRFTPDRAGRILAQLCDVLQAAHEAGIVHRDLKPGNLMVLHPSTPQETVKLMDFGLAKMSALFYLSADEVFDYSLPSTAGTPEYICPEQVRSGETDGRGDLYSAGVILFEMLTGKRPFERPSIRELLLAHLEETPPTFAELGLPDLAPPALEQVIRDCMEKHPEDRPKSALELALGYEKALGKRINVRRSPATVTPASTPPPASPATPPEAQAGLPAGVPSREVRRLTGPGPATAAGPNSKAVQRPSQLSQPAPATASAPITQTPPPASRITRAVERNTFQQSVEATMPEAMAMLKLKGFIFDLHGEIIESLPGKIRVRVPDPHPEPPRKTGLFGWGKAAPVVQNCAELELHVERKDPSQPGKLTITLVLRPQNGQPPAGWKERCRLIGRDFHAYLMGR